MSEITDKQSFLVFLEQTLSPLKYQLVQRPPKDFLVRYVGLSERQWSLCMTQWGLLSHKFNYLSLDA